MKVPRIFLCHASEDKPQVRNIYKQLIEIGLNVWFDEKNLLPGQIWEDVIRKELKKTDFILIFFSSISTRKRGFVQKEMKIALNIYDEFPEGKIFIIPVRLDNCKLPSSFEKIQYCDLFIPDGFRKILEAINFQWEFELNLPINNDLSSITKRTNVLKEVIMHLNEGKISDAESKIEIYGRKNDFPIDYWYWIAKIAFSQKKNDAALEYINIALSKNENHILSIIFKIKLLLIGGGKGIKTAELFAKKKYGVSKVFDNWVDDLITNKTFNKKIITYSELEVNSPEDLI